MAKVIRGRVIVAGRSEIDLLARGKLLACREGLSLWGGYDQHSGEITDLRHPLYGQVARNCILALPGSRGSSTTTAVLLEAARSGNAPAAIITVDVDTFFTLASIVADELYGKPVAVLALDGGEFDRLLEWGFAELFRNGEIRLYNK